MKSTEKTLPNNAEAESAVIGILMRFPEYVPLILDELKSSMLFSPRNYKIFETITDLWLKNKPTDYISVSSELQKENMNDYLQECYDVTFTATNWKHYVELIVECYRKREIIKHATEMLSEANYGNDSHEIIDKFSSNILSLQGQKKEVSLSQKIHELNDMIDRKQENDFMIGLPSGLDCLDRLTCGWQKKDLIIIAARPSLGKTSLAINCIRTVLRAGKRVGLFSLEMSDIQITARILAQEAEINGRNLMNGTIKFNKMEFEKYTRAQAVVSEYIKNLYFDEYCREIISIRAKAQAWKLKFGIDLIVLDYLGLMSIPKGGSVSDGVEYLTVCLKGLAKDLDVPILLLSQLTRSNERDNREPELHDLRSSGGIEQSADLVLFIHSKKEQLKSDELGGYIPEETWLLLKKQRNGPTGRERIIFNRESALFKEEDPWKKQSIPPDYFNL